jgi:hypothetical protein
MVTAAEMLNINDRFCEGATPPVAVAKRVNIVAAIARGQSGFARLRIHKNRPPNAAAWRTLE